MTAPRLLLLSMVLAATAFGQNLRVVTVPYVAMDPSVPHQAFNGHRTILKAIARGGNGSYSVEWDYEGDGTFDVASTRTNRYDLSTAVTYPTASTDVTYNAVVRVTSAGQTVTATYPVRVFADVPADPNLATDRQLQVMRNVAVDDGLWFLHNQLTRSGNEENTLTGAQITGAITANTTFTSGTFLEALGRNQRYPAFPAASYLGVLPDAAENNTRWAQDPYAEDAARLVNYLLTQASVVAVTAQDEANLTGFYPEQTATPITGTDDGIGLYIGSSPGDQTTGYAGAALRGLAVSRLTGFVAQVGDSNRVLGRRFEFIVQQLVDGLVWAQNDGGSYPGSWYFTPNANADLLGEWASGTIEVIEALWLAEQQMGGQGVIVPNLVKARLASFIQQNVNACPGGGTGGTMNTASNGVCDFALTSAHVFALGWVGANGFSTSDNRLAFPSYNGLTRGQLRAIYDSSLVFITNTWTTGAPGSVGWDQGFVEGGNFGRVDGLGNLYSMLHWGRAARAVVPEIVSFGPHTWARQFSRFLINNQAVSGGWNWVFSGTLGSNNDNIMGPAGRAAWAVLTLTPDELMPVAWATVTPGGGAEGASLTFTAFSTVPGGTLTWGLGNGEIRTGSPVVYSYPDNGNFNVTLTVTTPGGTSVASLPVVITNEAPLADAGADLTVDEGEVVTLTGSFTDPGSADTHTFSWNFGDAQTATTRTATHAWEDQGVFTATFSATDDDLGLGSDRATITVRNVAPTITSTPALSATEGTAWTYTMTFNDPGAADTHTCSTTIAPAGRTLTGCAWQWTPNFAQALAGTHAFTLCVTDDDGAPACQSFTVTTAVIDTDTDGLPDTWETANFGNLAATATADPDLDGLTNLEELNGFTNPNTSDGPTAPTATCSARVTNPRPTLTVTNAVDPQGTPLTRYEFELYDDAALTSLVISDADVPAGATSTSWRVPVVLAEDGRYFWRARTRDQSTNGPWTMPACQFLVDAVNALPGAPRLDSPTAGATVSSLQPSLVVGNAVDPELDALTYEFELFQGATRVGMQQGVTEGTGTTTWQTPALEEDAAYAWRARAVSAGGAGPWTEPGLFRVNTTNATPPAPLLVSPQEGATLDTLSPVLAFFPAADADGDVLVFDWELADDERFTTPLASGQDVTVTRVMPTAPLAEDSRACWRVRADDGQAQSPWASACFKVSTTDGPPNVPTTFNPSSGSVVATLTPLFSWAAAVDPEGAPVFYDVEVKEGATVVASLTGVGGNAAVGPQPLTDGKTYSWRVRAHTGARGPASAYSPDSSFEVRLPQPVEAPAPAPTPPPAGCGVTPGGSLLLGVVLLLGRRRRAAQN